MNSYPKQGVVTAAHAPDNPVKAERLEDDISVNSCG